jgi:hypothetical protein
MTLTEYFHSIGAELRISRTVGPARPAHRTFRRIASVDRATPRTSFDLNVAGRGKAEHFTLRLGPDAPEFRVLQANRAARHLLLHAAGDDGGERFLCGHDERHWFVAGIAARVTTITDARRALLPEALRHLSLDADTLAHRHNEVFKRQGEWFFVPTSKDLSKAVILHGEPLMRNTRSKPHVVAELVRFGGTPVVLWNGTEYEPEAFNAMILAAPSRQPYGSARMMVKDPEVYARGAVRHADHATLHLPTWHRVYANVEAWSENVSFYD